MPLTGTLRDMSLPNIVQFQCSEQNQAQVILTRNAHKGTLIFASGELVYARADELSGEDAVYELLTWDQASFRVDNEAVAVERNVTTPWGALLIEGLRRADESQAERDRAMEIRLRSLIDKHGMRAALVLRPDGQVRADARGEFVTDKPAAIMTAIANVEKIRSLLGLAALRQVALFNPSESVWLKNIDGDFLVCWVNGSTTQAALEEILHDLN
jgi:hypothetical protein